MAVTGAAAGGAVWIVAETEDDDGDSDGTVPPTGSDGAAGDTGGAGAAGAGAGGGAGCEGAGGAAPGSSRPSRPDSRFWIGASGDAGWDGGGAGSAASGCAVEKRAVATIAVIAARTTARACMSCSLEKKSTRPVTLGVMHAAPTPGRQSRTQNTQRNRRFSTASR